jgi:hypothetical protein
MILPIVLHKTTRDSLPKKKDTPLGLWLKQNSSLCVGFPERLISMKTFTQEAILYGISNNGIILNSEGELNSDWGVNKVNNFLRKLDGDARDCVLRARLLGRWLGNSGSTQNIMFLWGIRP